MTKNLERAKQRRLLKEQQEQIFEQERIAAAQEKLRKLEERLGEKGKRDSESEGGTGGSEDKGSDLGLPKEGGKRQRTESGSSDGSGPRQGREGRGMFFTELLKSAYLNMIQGGL